MTLRKSLRKISDFESSRNSLYKINPDANVELISALKEITHIAFPTMFFFVGVYLQQTINLIYIGHFYDEDTQKDALDGVGISHLYINCSLLSLVIGIISGFETLGANSYGAKRYYLMGLYIHRSVLIGYSITICLIIFHFIFAVRILGLLGLDERVLFFVAKYIRIMMFFVLFDVQYSINFRYFNIIGKSHINLVILSISILLHPIWCYIFIVIFNMGVQGAAISLVLSQMFNCFGGIYYILVHNPLPESIFPFNKDSFKGWIEYLKIALPSAFLMCAEWLAYEISAIIAIWIGKLDYTVHILLSSINLNLFTIAFGFGQVACVIIGNAITKKSVSYVKQYCAIIITFGFTVTSFACFILYLFRENILYIYISDIEIVEKGKEVIPILCIYTITDVSQNTLAGIFRGLGKQNIASKVAFVNFYITMYIFAIYFGKYLGWGVYGLWVGLLIGYGVNALSYLILFLSFDFNQIQKDILKRLDYDTKLIEEEETSDYIHE